MKKLLAGLLFALFLNQPAAADLQYGIEVEQPELLFMMGQFSQAADLELGRSGSGDHSQAAHHYRMAAVLGFPPAQYGLARLYEQGYGIPQNFTQAYVWYSLAALRGDVNAAENRKVVAQHLSRENLREARALVRQLQDLLP